MEDISKSLIFAIRKGKLERVKEIIEAYGISYSEAWSEGYDLLCYAIRRKHTKIAELLLLNGSKVNRENKDISNTPLYLAIKYGVEIVGMLLDRDADINAKNENCCTALHESIKIGKIGITGLLLNRGADPNVSDNNGLMPLHIAAKFGDLQAVKDLVKHEAYINSGCASGSQLEYTPLHFACALTGVCNEEIVKWLLDNGADINANTKDKLQPLYIATKNGNTRLVKLLLAHGANVNTQNEDGKSVLHLAVENGNLMIIEDILKYSPDVNNRNNRRSLNAAVLGLGKIYRTITEKLLEYGFIVDHENINYSKVLHAAVRYGYPQIFKDLLDCGADINMSHESTHKNYTLLHSAIKCRQYEIVEVLINNEADVNAKDEIGIPPIYYAFDNIKIFKLLLTKGANVKDTPELLHLAVTQQLKEIVELLLQHDVDINASDENGRTALHYTALDEDLDIAIPDSKLMAEIARLLLSNGAYVNAQTNNGQTALELGIIEQCPEAVEVLLEYNANLNVVEESATLPLHVSARQGNLAITKMLLNKGANINAKQKDGTTALHIATQCNRRDVVEALLESGANVDSKIKGYLTPLLIAAQNCNKGNLERLLEFGADIHARDDQHRTALHIACTKGYDDIVAILLSYGSDVNIKSENNTPLDAAIAGFIEFSDVYNPPRFNSYKQIFLFLKVHIVKMKAANLYVNEKNLSSISNHYGLSAFQQICKQELESMQNEKIGDGDLSFRDFLTDNTNKLAIYVRDENVVKVITSHDFKSKFSIYATMIYNYFKKGMQRKERKELLEPCHSIFNSLFNVFPQLPYICIEKIFSFLSNRDITFFINTCKPNTHVKK